MSIKNGFIDQGGKLADHSTMAAGEVMEGNAGAQILGQDNDDSFENSNSNSKSASGASGHMGMAGNSQYQKVEAKKKAKEEAAAKA